MAIFNNQASLTYQNVTTNSNVATGEILDAVSITKTAVTEIYQTGEDLAWVISLINTGTTPLTGLSVTDDLGTDSFETLSLTPLTYHEGSVRLFTNGVLQTPPTVTLSTGSVTFSGINIPAGGSALILYESTANEYASPAADGEITNTATVSGGGIATPIQAEETVRASQGAQLAITKSLSPTQVTENSRLTYTFVLQNFGNEAATAEGGAVLSDTFNPILQDLTVTYNGTAWTSGTQYTYNTTTGEFNTVAGQIVIPAATFLQDSETGVWTSTPGVATITVEGTV